MEIEQRSEAYRMYVTDSLFFLQHIFAGGANDDDRRIFSLRYADIFNADRAQVQDNDDRLTPDDIINRMRKKARNMDGER